MKYPETLADAYKNLGREKIVIPAIPGLSEPERKHLNDYQDLLAAVSAINQIDNDGKPWEPNWSDGSLKWENWFRIDASAECPSGVGFSFTRTDCVFTITDVGSRLCFKTQNGARFAASAFKELYQSFLLKVAA